MTKQKTTTTTTMVLRAAPQWAWDTIDETLALDAQSAAFDSALRREVGVAAAAMRRLGEDRVIAALDAVLTEFIAAMDTGGGADMRRFPAFTRATALLDTLR